ncbi:unnamed protein product, partial [Closterium sp. Yama58-4]
SMAYNYLTYRVPPVSASLKAIVLSNNFLSGTFPANSATSCVSAANCFTSATSCNTPTEQGDTAQRASGCAAVRVVRACCAAAQGYARPMLLHCSLPRRRILPLLLFSPCPVL